MSNFGKGGAEFFFNLLKLFLVQSIASSDFSPEFNELLHECGGVEVLALRRGVVRSDRVTLGCWLVLRFLPQLRACRSLVVVDLLIPSILGGLVVRLGLDNRGGDSSCSTRSGGSGSVPPLFTIDSVATWHRFRISTVLLR